MVWGIWPRRRRSVWGASTVRRPLLAAAVAAMIACGPTAALAHVEIDIGNGKYAMTIGFRDEPTYVDQPNALVLSVQQYGTGGTKPVDGLAGAPHLTLSKSDRGM